MVDGERPVKTYTSDEPASFGVGRPVACVVELKLASVIADVEYRKSYEADVPSMPLSPGEVHEMSVDVCDICEALRSVIWEGGVVSGMMLGNVVKERLMPIVSLSAESNAWIL